MLSIVNKFIHKKIQPLFAIMFFDQTSLCITVPLLTLVFFDNHSHFLPTTASHATRALFYGLCLSIPNILNIIISPILSIISDKIGRKVCLGIGVLGALLYALTALIGVYYSTISIFIIAAIIRGLFTKTNPIALAIVGDVSSTKNKLINMSTLQVAISLGAFIGPIIGGFIATHYFYRNYSLGYLLSGLFAAIGLLATLLFFTESLQQKSTKNNIKISWKNFWKLCDTPQIKILSIILIISQISWSTYYQFMPPLLKLTLHFSASQIGLFVGLIAAWLALTTTFGTRILNKYLSITDMLNYALFAIILGLGLTIICSFFTQNWLAQIVIWLSALPIAVGDVVIFTCITTLYSNAVPQNQQGHIQGLCYTIVAIIWTITSFLGSFLLAKNPILILIVPFLSLIGYMLMHHKNIHQLSPAT